MGDFDAFLLDHAACERKASSQAMHFVVRYPDRGALIDPMITLAREELSHFQRVYRLIVERGLTLGPDTKDPYVHGMRGAVRNGREDHFLDRLLVYGVVEARGCERFGLIAAHLDPGPLKDFYQDITQSEERHHQLFTRLAGEYFADDVIRNRLDELLDFEAQVVDQLAFRPALH